MSLYIFTASVIGAWLLDLLLGDPLWLPHPVVAFGNAISSMEKWLNRGSSLFLKGALAVSILVVGCFAVFYLVQSLIIRYIPVVFPLFILIFVFFGLANRTLIAEGTAVFKVLKNEGVEAGRKQLSRIVGRDTSQLTPQQIRIAVLETMSENLSDGVVAPLFWFGVAGVPGIMTYKMVNTLDSMWGYRDERFNLFGRSAARLDDVANYIPARITGVLIAIAGFSARSFRFMALYARNHKSPNSGYPESALAGVLDCRFGGSAVYHGIVVDKPFIGVNGRDITDDDIGITSRINHIVCFVSVVLVVAVRMFYTLI